MGLGGSGGGSSTLPLPLAGCFLTSFTGDVG